MPCTCMHLADLPELKHLQNRKKCLKRAKLAGVVINNMLELKQTMLLHHQQLPKSVSTALVVAKTAEQRGLVYYVPMDAAAFHVEGVVFTGRQQIQWVVEFQHSDCNGDGHQSCANCQLMRVMCSC